MRLPKTVIVGSANLDLVARVPRLPRPGETVGGGSFTTQIGGKGANVATAIAQLGAPVAMVAAVGNDASGRRVLDSLTAAGIDTTRVQVIDKSTGTALIVVDDRGENQIAVSPGANARVRVERADVADAGLVLSQLEVPLSVVVRASELSTGYFALNASPVAELPPSLLARCDLVVVNEQEYDAIPSLSGLRLVAVTYGSEGAALFRLGREAARVRAVETNVVSSVGAGDSFFAALSLGLASGHDEFEALSAATAVGAAAVRSPESQPVLESLASYIGRVGEFDLRA